MIPRQGYLPVRVLKIWFDIVLALGGLALLLLLAYLAAAPFLWTASDAPLDAVIQVAIGTRSLKPVYPLAVAETGSTLPGVEAVHLVDGSGELRFLTRDRWLHASSLGEILLASAVILYLIWLLRKVLLNVLADDPFNEENGRCLSRCGYIVVLLGVVVPVLDYALSSYTLARLEITNLDLRPAITLNKDIFALGLLFLVFGVILRRAHQVHEHERALEEEQAFTI